MSTKNKESTITVFCNNGHKLWRYKKVGAGLLQKCYEDMIGRDYTGDNTQLDLGQTIFCAQCEPPLAVAIVKIISGRRAYEVTSGVRKIRT